MSAIRLATLLVTLALSPAPPAPVAYSGTGAWIDRYDFATLGDPELAVAQMASRGVRTLYVETASWRVPRGVDIVAPLQTAALITSAHAHGMQVVAWYLPGFKDMRTDLRRVRAALSLRTLDDQAFDAFALDIEATQVRSLARRNARMLRLSRMTRAAAGPSYELGAIVPDLVATSNGPVLWPHFPYSAAAEYYDVFLPMAYSTLNRARGARAVYRYTAANVRFVSQVTGKPVHVIGGLTDDLTRPERNAVERAATDSGAIGSSLY